MTDEEANQVAESGDRDGRGIFDGFSGYVTPTEDDWKSVLGSGMLVVDTNVLLNLYRYNQDARAALLETLRKFDRRLWVPHQVMEEFWRNRESALDDPEKQLEQSVAALRSGLDKTFSDLRNWINRVSLDRSSALRLEATLSTALEEVIGEMEAVVDSSGVEMARDTSKDKVVSDLAVLLAEKIGAPLSVEDHAAAIIEGKRRIEEQIPPGYKDKKKQARGDDSEAGDYLVWFQLISEAKRRGEDVLMVTGDIKDDWWRIRNGMTLGPRNELAEELLREAGVRLYMLKPDRLLTYARDFLQVAVSEDSVQNVEMVDAQSFSDEAFGEIERMSEGNPTGAFFAAWGEVERAVYRTLSTDDPLQHRRTTPMRVMKELERQMLVSQDLARSFAEMVDIRNRISHGVDVQLTQEGAAPLISKARNIINALNAALAPHAQMLRLEAVVTDMALAAGYEVRPASGGADRGYDFRVYAPSRPEVSVGVEIVYYAGGGEFSMKALESHQRNRSSLPNGLTSLLIVTNASLSDSVRQFNDSVAAGNIRATEGSHRVEIVQFQSGDDGDQVLSALARALH
ncbi:PIN-like domain-containing protein [Streptomyces sp. NPDC127091]|uniref:PIN-like domain-containing protein n=1 Tax=Streptomyces sp. NPDC127091 TaxID=3347134 RepID=UPI0036579C97